MTIDKQRPDTVRGDQPTAGALWPIPHYVVGLWALVGLLFVAVIIRSSQVGIWVRDPGDRYFYGRIAVSLGVLVGVLGMVVAVRAIAARRRGRPGFATAYAELRRTWTKPRVAWTAAGLLAYHVIYLLYHNLKSWNAFNHQVDDRLLSVDRRLFFGHDPAVLLHDLLGTGWADRVLVVVYQSFSAVIMFAAVAFLVLAPTLRAAYVALCAVSWIWILGAASYYVLPTLGPFASEPRVFAGLPRGVISHGQAGLLADRTFLLQHPHDPTAFAAIGAFASLHVGVTATIVLLLRHYGLDRLWRLTAGFLVLVMLATIYLGYHYVLDDVAGLILAYVSVRLGRWMVYPRGDDPS